MNDLNAVVDFVFQTMTQVFNLYMGYWLLTLVLAIWLVRKVVKLFQKL